MACGGGLTDPIAGLSFHWTMRYYDVTDPIPPNPVVRALAVLAGRSWGDEEGEAMTDAMRDDELLDAYRQIISLRARLAEVERERDVFRDDAIRYVGLLAEARDERDAAIAAPHPGAGSVVLTSEEAERLLVAGDGLHDDTVLYHPKADVIPKWNEARRALLRAKGVG